MYIYNLQIDQKFMTNVYNIIPYSCPRCGYKIKHRRCMSDHLFKKKKPCPATLNEIELTDFIKNYILDNRVYKIPKITTPKIIILKNNEELNSGAIYIYYTRSCKNADESVYKIGKAQNYLKRKNGYEKGGDMLFVINVSNRHECENIVKDAFKKEYIPRRDYGYEYFEGDIFEMVVSIKDILSPYILDTIVEFKVFNTA